MIVIPISNKTLLVRHWFRWYRVQRGGTDWHPIKVQKRPAPIAKFDLDKTISKLKKAGK